jgi:type VI secretion system protein
LNLLKPILLAITYCAVALIMTSQISGCSLLASKVDLQKVTIDVEPQANGNTPLALDFVAASDAQMLERLKATPASQWFEQRQQLQRDYPKGFSVWSLEVVPGQLITFNDNPLQGVHAEGVLLFARYSSQGAHRLLLGKQNNIWLKIGSREMRLLDTQGQ